MSEVRATKNLVAIVEGDSWRGLPVIRIRVNGVAPTPAVSSAEMLFKRNLDDAEEAYRLSTDESTITITDADEWEFTIPAVLDFPLENGTWFYNFKTIRTDGYKRTYFGGTFKILKT